jgi:hypothetical protein
MTITELMQANEQRDLLLKDKYDNVILLPQNWVIHFYEMDDKGRETYTYAATHNRPNSPVQNLWMPLKTLAQLPEITEEEAKKLHPNLFVYLDAINREEDVDDWSAFWKRYGEIT